jgi:hypothetical protein
LTQFYKGAITGEVIERMPLGEVVEYVRYMDEAHASQS